MGSACRFALFGTLLYASYSFGMQSPSSDTESDPDAAGAMAVVHRARRLATVHSQLQRPLELSLPDPRPLELSLPDPRAPFMPPIIAPHERPPELNPAGPSYAAAGQINPLAIFHSQLQRPLELVPPNPRAPLLPPTIAPHERPPELDPASSSDAVAPSLPAIHRPDGAICQFTGSSLCSIVRCIDAGGACGKSYYRGAMNCAQKFRLSSGEMVKKVWGSLERTRTACQSCKCKLQRPDSGLKRLSPSAKTTCKMSSMRGVTCILDDCEGAGGECVLEEQYDHCFLKTPERTVPAGCKNCRCGVRVT
jgi:hypothetical protein